MFCTLNFLGDFIFTIWLPDDASEDPKPGDRVCFYGWGDPVPEHCVRVKSNEECDKEVDGNINESHICIENPNGSDGICEVRVPYQFLTPVHTRPHLIGRFPIEIETQLNKQAYYI